MVLDAGLLSLYFREQGSDTLQVLLGSLKEAHMEVAPVLTTYFNLDLVCHHAALRCHSPYQFE